MNLASFIISVCLHTALLLLILFWPAPEPLHLSAPPIMISLVEGAPGGNRLPSPILGSMGEAAQGENAPAAPAPKAEVAAPAREEIMAPDKIAPRQAEAPAPAVPEPVQIPEPKPVPVPEPPKPEARPEPKPEPRPKPEPKPEAKPEPKKPEPKKPEPKKPEPKKPTPKKPAPKQNRQPADPVAAALQQARRAASRADSGDRGNAIEQALNQARKSASGNRGGGGGEGDGPGGGGLGDVYIGQVMLAVRPNWGFASSGRKALACVVKVIVDLQGKVQRAEVTKGSGNAQFDASAVNAVIRTSQAGDFPVPPSQEYTDLDLVFTLDEMMGR
ncbi:MAG: TonB C-terminal domain-containing protein [Desulfovibrio sp.]|nr:TonB C-terminal domain-containing protein [Desulfovibrio sp.]